jgi:FkbM family methyltransferase
MSYSQIKQDVWVLDKLKNKNNGFFVDIGAYDGVNLSNTFLLEELGWNGICVECNEQVLPKLRSSRKAKVCDRPIYSSDDKELFLIDPDEGGDGTLAYVNQNSGKKLNPSISISTLLEEYGAPKDIDYISLDIEGGELRVLESFDFKKYNVQCWTIEHNLNSRNLDNFVNIVLILLKHGYLVKWHDWDIFAVKDNISSEYIIDGVRVK